MNREPIEYTDIPWGMIITDENNGMLIDELIDSGFITEISVIHDVFIGMMIDAMIKNKGKGD